MDPDTALILQLLREDAEQAAAVARGKGKNPEGTQTDAQVALNVFLTDLLTTEAFLADQKMALSIQRAVQLDGDALFQSEEEERRARRDRNMSLALSTGQDGVTASEAGPGAPSDDPEYLEKLQYLYVTGIDTITEDNVNISDDETLVNSQPESSRWAASRPAKKQPQKRECAACGDLKHFAQLAKAPCQHEYCRECLTHLFRDATLDESLFPPRCCKQTIPLDKNRLFLDYDVVQLFRKKAVEFSTPRRTYCHDRNCGAFIPQTNYVDDTATCVECRRQTCITCKNAHHGGDCPNDEQLQGVIQLARQQGWQRCQNCWGMVELNMGCYHMTCRCGFQFCYVCGARWKSCRCEHWEERRLYERAVEIDARDAAARGAAQNRAAPVEQRLVERPAARPQPAQGTVALLQQTAQRLAEQRAAEQRAAEQRAAEQRAAEQREAERRQPAQGIFARPLQWLAEQRAAEQREAERRQAEQQRAGQQHFELELAALRQAVQLEFSDSDSDDEEAEAERIRQLRVRELMEHLRVNHECNHQSWTSRRGPRKCEECNDVMPLFIYECRQCRIMACRRCRYNRL